MNVRQVLTAKERAKLDSLQRTGANQMRWTLRGGSGVNYNLEQSTNLQTWTPWAALTNFSGTATFTNDLANDLRFYRAVEP